MLLEESNLQYHDSLPYCTLRSNTHTLSSFPFNSDTRSIFNPCFDVARFVQAYPMCWND